MLVFGRMPCLSMVEYHARGLTNPWIRMIFSLGSLDQKQR